MCGIVGYVGSELAKPFLIDGLKRLEYRGYDSAGIALLRNNSSEVIVRRCLGPVDQLAQASVDMGRDETFGIAHTRWATHGAPSELNAHPHRAGSVVLVHNGIIENHNDLRESLVARGVKFLSQTDTEVFAWLLEKEIQDQTKVSKGLSPDVLVLNALSAAAQKVHGHFSVIFMSMLAPGFIFGVQMGAPLVCTQAKNGVLVASDVQALLEHSQKISFVPVNTLLSLNKSGVMKFFDVKTQEPKTLPVETVAWNPDQSAKDGFDHFMLKEIYQQPMVVADTLSGRLPESVGGPFLWDNAAQHEALWTGVKKLILVGCGTAHYASMVAKYFFERWAQLPVEIDLASEFRYRSPVFESGTLLGVISQSGETADTLSVLRMAQAAKVPTFSICNVSASTISRESSFRYPTKAGPEIGVASTKAFTTQLTVLCSLAQDVARIRGRKIASTTLSRLPHDMNKLLESADRYLKLGASLDRFKTILFVGRGMMYPIALEGALKVKEITYRHAEGYAAGELKHGPIALVDRNLAAIVLAPSDELLPKTLSNLEEIKSRGGYIIALGDETNTKIAALCDEFVALPHCDESCAPMLYVMPLQLMAYGLAKHLGCSIDKPRNLAKSVTVE
jgi:glucosamine--fructose-6-phosphate aminotransferase (isomerizing)